MNPTPALPPILVPAGSSLVVRAFGGEVVFHLTGEQTGGAFTQ
ncbi:MAG: hypothetical protein NTW21_39510 [Verrucomicrobia bacterium]|nr:hypothetical protein [Verrucomicrobiota bacterium]